MNPTDSNLAFSALRRVYGETEQRRIEQMHICVVGLGGVGSWAVEALARSGVGRLRLIDPDVITESNINRQLPALHSTLGRAKVDVMTERVMDINPACRVEPIEDMLVEKNQAELLSGEFDMVIDAIDAIRFKAALIHTCRRRKQPVITVGGAGGRVDPLAVSVADLSRTWNDALAAKVRSRLRSEFHFSSNPKRRFGVDCVFSTEQPRYPDGAGEVGQARPGIPGARLDCERGYGSSVIVTATFGFVAAGRALHKALARRARAASVD